MESTTSAGEPQLGVLPFERADIEGTIPMRFERVVGHFPNRVALTGRGRRWSYLELDAAANRIARAIRESTTDGVGCVAYLTDHSPEMVIATLSVLKAGKTYLAIHPGMPTTRQAGIVQDVGPELILTTAPLANRAREIAAGTCPLLVLDDIGDGRIEAGPQPVALPQQLSTVFCTSGTTGDPKAVVKSHRAVLHRVWLAVKYDSLGPNDRVSLLTHCAFSASEVDMFGALLNGATLCVFDFLANGLSAFREWLEAERVTVLHPPVLLFRRFLSTLEGEDLFPAVRLVALAGDVVLAEDVQAWRRHFGRSCVLMHRFSTTETGLLCVARIEGPGAADPGRITAGRPVADKAIQLIDASGRQVPVGEIGEIVVKSAYIADGYWSRSGAAESRFATDPEDPSRRTYRTGDLGRFLPGGDFVFLGRRDRQIKLRGFRVELAEIEAALRSHPAIGEATVIVQDREPQDKQLVAYVVPSAEPSPGGTDLSVFLQQRLPQYMIPSGFIFLNELPLTPTGKVDRHALPPFTARSGAGGVAEPRSDLERALVSIWEDVLGVERVGIHDNFFDLGGHSLLAAQLFVRVEQTLGVRLPLASLLHTPTVETLAAGIAAGIAAGQSSQAWQSLVPIQATGTRPPLFAVPGAGGNVVGFGDLARLLGSDQPFYGLQSRGLSGSENPLEDVEQIAETYVREIRSVQPRGPYHLIGVCMGAVVAFEMAQRLHAAGEQVGLLALLEPRPPATRTRRSARVAPRATTALRLIGGRLRLYFETFAKLRGRDRLEYLRARATMIREMIAARDLWRGSRAELHSLMVRRSNVAAVHGYRPRDYPGRLALFLAAGRHLGSDRDERLNWKELAHGGTEVHFVPGDDSGLTLTRPGVDVLAPLLRASLDRVLESAPPASDGQSPAVAEVPATEDRRDRVDTVADAFLERLVDHGVDYVFINPGSDIAPIQEAIVKFGAQSRRAPQLVLCVHESVALAAAHGYFMMTGRPQVVLVHADVGTQNLGANVHNAQRGRAGVVICAGAPPTGIGDGPCDRNREMDWIQHQRDQAGIVAGYVKWHHRLDGPDDLESGVDRAFELAGEAPEGPVYLILPKEVLLAARRLPSPVRVPVPTRPPLAPEEALLARAAEWLIAAERPVILTAYAGRRAEGVVALSRLADAIAAPVVESRHRLNFPSSHPMHVGFYPFPFVQQADCILIVDHDVPWVPAEGRPSPGCRVIQVDIDAVKRDMPIWGFPVDLSIPGESARVLPAVVEEIERRLRPGDRVRIETRRGEVSARSELRRTSRRTRATELGQRRPIAPEWAAHCLNELVDDDTVIVGDAVSNNPILWHHLELDAPGTYYQSQGSGLGWGLGAALGAKLAAPEKTIICVVGDGCFLFGSPLAAYLASQQCRSPFLTVVFNNQRYAATVDAIRSVAPAGFARRTGRYPACDLPQPPFLSGVAGAIGLWARSVDDPTELSAVLREALDQVRRGRSALVDICVSSRPDGAITERQSGNG